ncbi:uncharacterized protein DUF4253 [Bacillus oleivorans]|uniref:Uncharacterized protein DUF4253 n=1 Tax=Bacillus oleivorans TaxID=1448271 RepID=A0A285D6Q4_9BACI|nr:DUF4253 domain-containing protein [Bacillus oleivorans]SNX75026.1 uncharacterized protein DUF4253 [Bacillus oleivorans]
MDWKKLFGFGNKHKNEIMSDQIAKEIGFTEEVIHIIKASVSSSLQPLIINELYNEGETRTAGISFMTPEDKAEKVVVDLQSRLKQMGYLVFICERDFGNERKSMCKVGIIKGHDQFEILKVQQTNGDNYDISNEDVSAKLREWNDRYPFNMIGADYDWVEAIFSELPADQQMKSFAQEIYEFCPDVVDQGTETIEALIEEMRRTNKLFLWWD